MSHGLLAGCLNIPEGLWQEICTLNDLDSGMTFKSELTLLWCAIRTNYEIDHLMLGSNAPNTIVYRKSHRGMDGSDQLKSLKREQRA
jgi:hypothetical protein